MEIKDYINDYDADVYDLEISQENFEILMERIENMSDLSTFRRLLFDFYEFLTPELRKRVIESYNRVSKDKEMVIIEGTGHAGVGSVFDMSNAEVAGFLGAKVVLVTCGGIGQPIDRAADRLFGTSVGIAAQR